MLPALLLASFATLTPAERHQVDTELHRRHPGQPVSYELIELDRCQLFAPFDDTLVEITPIGWNDYDYYYVQEELDRATVLLLVSAGWNEPPLEETLTLESTRRLPFERYGSEGGLDRLRLDVRRYVQSHTLSQCED